MPALLISAGHQRIYSELLSLLDSQKLYNSRNDRLHLLDLTLYSTLFTRHVSRNVILDIILQFSTVVSV